MVKMTNATMLVTGLASLTLGLFGLLFISFTAYAQPERAVDQALPSATATALISTSEAGSSQAGGVAEGPFMGVADPVAPYDLRFIDEMVMHHQGAIISSRMMVSGSTRPQLRDLASRIQKGQQQQIDQMQAWRKQWYPNAPRASMSMDMMGGGQGSGMMSGMMSGQGSVDRMFLRMMIPHHQLAIDMSNDALHNAQHQELKGLAHEIIAGQSVEITEMEGHLHDWYGEGSTRDTAGSMREMMTRVYRP